MALGIGELDPGYLAVAVLAAGSIVVFVYKLYLVHGERDALVHVAVLVLMLGAALAGAVEPATANEAVTVGKHGLALGTGLAVLGIFYALYRLDEGEDILKGEGQGGN